MSSVNHAPGVLLGAACGDALGRPVEFRSATSIQREFGLLDEMIGGGSHNKPAGTITDDTELALCIARSLTQQEGFDGADIAARFVEWYKNDPFDIGLMTADSLRKIRDGVPWDEAGQEVWNNRREGQNAGNGSVMRCAPHAIAFSEDPERLLTVSKTSSRITHADPRCTYGCAVLNLTVREIIAGKDTPLATALDRVRSDAPDELIAALDPIAEEQTIENLQNTGYVVHSLQTALHDAFTAENIEDAIVTAVNRGGDTDTIGAITGAVAGARFGSKDLPEPWLEVINEREELIDLAMTLDKLVPV